jgi:hypothetical protein
VAVRKMLGGGVPIVQCDVDGHGQLVLNSLPRGGGAAAEGYQQTLTERLSGA